MLTVRHKLIIRHPSDPAAIIVTDEDGGALPWFDHEDRHTAEVDYINAAVRAQCGVGTTVLRSLRHDDDATTGNVIRVHELEVHDQDWMPPLGLRWADPQRRDAVGNPYDASVLAEYVAERARPPLDGRDWMGPGWWDDVCAWLTAWAAAEGVGPLEEIVQLRVWSSSCVVRLRAEAGGEFYFKAMPTSHQREYNVTAFLAREFHWCVPRIAAARPERRWLVLAGFPGPKLEEIADLSVWERAAAMYADLQVRCISRTDELRALGCGDRGVAGLADGIENLAADDQALLVGHPEGLSRAEAERLRALLPLLRQRCADLAACAIPYTLEHGDLWPGNFLVNASACVLIDWEDAAIGHPFFSLAPLIVGLTIYQPNLDVADAVERVRRAYVAAFARVVSPERVSAAAMLAEPLALFEMALRYRQQPASMVRLHPWMQTVVPQTVKLALAWLA